MLKHAQNIACSSWHGDTVQETLSSHRDGNFKAGNPLQRILFSQVLSKPSNNHLGVALQRNRLNSVLVIKNQIQLANPQYLCLYFKESSFQYAVSSFGLEKVGISSLSMINTTCRTQTQDYTQDKHRQPPPKPLLNPGLQDSAPTPRMPAIPPRAHPAHRPAPTSHRIFPSLWKCLWSSLK